MQHVPWLFVNKVDDLLQSLIIVGTINDTLPCPEQNESSCLDSHITDVGDSNFWSVLGWTVILVSQNHQHDVVQVGCVTVTVRVWELSGRRDLPGTLASSRLQSEISLELLTTVTRAGPEEDSDSRQLSLSSLSFKPEIKDLSPSKLDFLCWWRTRK